MSEEKELNIYQHCLRAITFWKDPQLSFLEGSSFSIERRFPFLCISLTAGLFIPSSLRTAIVGLQPAQITVNSKSDERDRWGDGAGM